MSVGSIGWGEWIVLILVAFTLIWPAARVCKRAGFPPALGLLILVPLVNIALLFYLAFAPWPALEERRASST